MDIYECSKSCEINGTFSDNFVVQAGFHQGSVLHALS